MSNTTYRVFVEHLGDQDANTFLADTGDLFWDRYGATLRLGDGTPGGIPIAGASGNVNAILAGAGVDVQDQGAGVYTITLTPATANTIGGIIAGTNANIDANGVLSIDLQSAINASKSYTDVTAGQLRANDFITLTAAQAYTDSVFANTGGGGGVSNAQLAQANTFLQANDALTLSVAQAYTNATNTWIQANLTANTDSANAYALSLVQQANTFLQANDVLTLVSAKAYTDAANTFLQTVIANTGNVLVTSNINSIATGAAIRVAIDRTNPAYTGGIFNIYQEGGTSASFDGNWTSTLSSSKLAYTDYANTIINTDSVTVRVLLGVGTWDIQANDDITIGSSVVTGADILALGISGAGGTYVVPSSVISPATEVALVSPISANLTQAVVGKIPLSDSSPLVTVQPTLFGLNSVSGSFPLSVVPYFNVNQAFNWSVTPNGTSLGGTLLLTGSQTATETSTGALSGTSAVYDSTVGPFNLAATYYGVGSNGSGQSTTSANSTVTPATSYVPMFYKTTSSNADPVFTTSDTYLTHGFVIGDGANSSTVVTDYVWMAIPGTGPAPVFKWDQFGFTFTITPDQIYNNVNISGQTYQVYGFTGFTATTLIYTSN